MIVEIFKMIYEFILDNNLLFYFRLLIIIVASLVAIQIARLAIKKTIIHRVSPQARLLILKAVRYTGVAVLALFVLSEFGVSLAPILGTAGIVGVTLGIAGQNTFSSLLAGLSIITENVFQIGDVIEVENKVGVVESIDLLSVKIKTFDNKLIRYPNKKLIDQAFTNITKFPIRRIDQKLTLPINCDMAKVIKILEGIAASKDFFLQDPAPLIVFGGAGAHYIEVVFGVWIKKTDYLEARNGLTAALQETVKSGDLRLTSPVKVFENLTSEK